MTRRTLGRVSVGFVAAAVLVAALWAQAASAQKIDNSPSVDQDFGRKLRHPPAGKRGSGWLQVPNSGRKSPDPRADRGPSRQSLRAQPSWEYRWFDHPTPSYQYFQQPRTYTWRYDSYPGLGRYYQPGYSPHYYAPPTYYYAPPTYYYAPPTYYYAPPTYHWRYGTGGWYGW